MLQLVPKDGSELMGYESHIYIWLGSARCFNTWLNNLSPADLGGISRLRASGYFALVRVSKCARVEESVEMDMMVGCALLIYFRKRKTWMALRLLALSAWKDMADLEECMHAISN